MAAFTSIVAAIGAIATVGGVIMSSEAQGKAQKAQERRAEVERTRAQNQDRAQQLKNIRQARLARAQSLAASTASGAAEGSAAQGALSSIGSQASYNIGTLAQDSSLAQQSYQFGTEANQYLSQASLYSNIATVGGGLVHFADSKGAKKIEKVFS